MATIRLVATDHPLPGDLVIREIRPSRGKPRVFVITLHPNRDLGGVPYPNLTSVVEHARLVASKRGGHLQIWRELVGDIYQNLTPGAHVSRSAVGHAPSSGTSR